MFFKAGLAVVPFFHFFSCLHASLLDRVETIRSGQRLKLTFSSITHRKTLTASDKLLEMDIFCAVTSQSEIIRRQNFKRFIQSKSSNLWLR